MNATTQTPPRPTGSYMLLWDARTPEGRAGAAAFFTRLCGPEKVAVRYTGEEVRARMLALVGEANVAKLEARRGFVWEGETKFYAPGVAAKIEASRVDAGQRVAA